MRRYVPINYIGARTSNVPLLMTKFAEQIQRGSSDAVHGRCSMAGPDKCSLICILEGEEGKYPWCGEKGRGSEK